MNLNFLGNTPFYSRKRSPDHGSFLAEIAALGLRRPGKDNQGVTDAILRPSIHVTMFV